MPHSFDDPELSIRQVLGEVARLVPVRAGPSDMGVAIADEHERGLADLRQQRRGLMLLACGDVLQVVLERRAVGPEGIDQPLDAIRVFGRELGREERSPYRTAQVTLVALLDKPLRRGDRDAASLRPRVVELPRPGRGEDQGTNAVRRIERHPLRHPPAHRVPEHVGGLEAEPLQQREGVGGEEPRCVPVVGSRRSARPPVVESDHRTALRPAVDQIGWPCRAGIAGARDQQ